STRPARSGWWIVLWSAFNFHTIYQPKAKPSRTACRDGPLHHHARRPVKNSVDYVSLSELAGIRVHAALRRGPVRSRSARDSRGALLERNHSLTILLHLQVAN